MKKLNLTLILGSFILALILYTCLFPKSLTSVNPYGIQNTRTVVNQQGVMSLEGAPFKPSMEVPLGTDEMGRDVLSLIIYGTRLTMTLGILIVIGRFLIALPLGIWAGFGSHASRAVINQFNAMFSAIPSLIICIIILKINFFASLYKRESIIAFVLVLTLTGWSKLGLIIMERVEDILRKPFIKGEIAIGKGTFQIAVQNVIPHLSAELVVMFFMELAMALSMVMQLGVFGVFIGNVKVMADSGIPANINYEPEWGGMISTGRVYISTAPWVILAPTIAFFLSILGANLFGEGIRIKIQDKNSNFIVNVRRALSFDRKAYEGKRFKTAAIILAFLILFVFSFNMKTKSSQVISTGHRGSIVDGFNYDRVIIGSSEAEGVAIKLGEELKNMGFEPLDENGYIEEYKIGNVYASLQSLVEINSSSGNIKLSEGKDYYFYGFGNYNLSGEILDLRNKDIYSLKDFNAMKDKFIFLSSELFSDSAIEYYTNKIIKEYGARGIIWSYSDKDRNTSGIGSRAIDSPVIYMSEEALKNIEFKNSTLRVELKSISLEGKGRNVMGILRGKDMRVGKDAIIIGVGYNYLNYEKDAALSKLKIILELGKKLKSQEKNLNRSIIIAFFDGTINDELNGIRVYANNVIYPSENSVLYMDLTGMNLNKANMLCYSDEKAPISRYFAWGFKRNLEMEFKKNNISMDRYVEIRSLEEIMNNLRVEDEMFYRGGIPTIILDAKQEGSGKEFTPGDIVNTIYKTIINNIN